MKSHISISPDICNGRPVISGTRIAVQTILEFLGAGDASSQTFVVETPGTQRELANHSG